MQTQLNCQLLLSTSPQQQFISLSPMAKSQRSSRKKQLRTQRAEKVTATWTAEADAKRLAALAACMEAEPVPVVNIMPEADDSMEQQRGRTGAAASADGMAVDGSSSQPGSSKKHNKKARKAATAAAAGGVRKKGKQTAGSKLAKEFSKKQKKQRR